MDCESGQEKIGHRGENVSLSSDGTVTSKTGETTANSRSVRRKGSEWEILGNLEKGVSYTIKPKRYEGYLLKRRKWPLKGWHRRCFVMDNGVLYYAKNSTDILRGRTLGKFNIGAAVISANYAESRIDIDTEESVIHVKAENIEDFGLFMGQLQQHRLYNQNIVNCGQTPLLAVDEVSSSLGGPQPVAVTLSTAPRGSRSARSNILSEFASLDETVYGHLEKAQVQVCCLVEMLHKLEEGPEHHGQKKKLFQLRKKKSGAHHQTPSAGAASGSSTSGKHSNTDRSSPVLGSAVLSHDFDSESSGTLCSMVSLSSSNPSLNNLALGRPTSYPGDPTVYKKSATTHSTETVTSKDELLNLVQEIQNDLIGVTKAYVKQKDQVKMLLESESKSSSMPSQMALIASLRQSLNGAMQQNTMLKNRLARIHAESDVGDTPTINCAFESTLNRGMNGSFSYSSSCISEFFDAREYAESGEDDSDDDGTDTDVSDTAESGAEDDDLVFLEASSNLKEDSMQESSGTLIKTGRRRTLPVPKNETEGVNLWNLLCKNIGKDLSKISMPVTLNEPLSVLQRLCEELEYSDLIEKAVSAESPLERLQWVTAFSISCYCSCNARASQKPFNPLLGETYECVRDDMGFKFIAEQVSHHPPVSAAHAEGSGWSWQQTVRMRSKFWGKSMEFQPEGKVTLKIETKDLSETYTWNKVTSCIHNILGAERWVDLYGEAVISCEESQLTSRIQFVKASYWSSKRHELFGTITDKDGTVLQNIFGKWSEALYVGKAPSARCIWRPGALPEDSHLYYGFSRFAIELNELVPKEAALLPPTDVRWRPDQRALEEGRIAEAENIKLGVEQAQRDRRRQRDHGQLEPFQPLWFRKTVETLTDASDDSTADKWEFSGDYWSRRGQGFHSVQFEPLW